MFSITTIYAMLPPVALACGLVLIAGAVRVDLRAFRAARDRCEKAYWLLRAAVDALFGYAVAMVGWFAVGGLRRAHWKLAEWLRSTTPGWHWPTDETFPVLTNVLLILMVALGLLCVALYFGHVDENDVWRPPRWRRRLMRHKRARRQSSGDS